MAKREMIIDIITFMLIILFLYTAINKIIDFKIFKDDLAKAKYLNGFSIYIAYSIPSVELIITLLLLSGYLSDLAFFTRIGFSFRYCRYLGVLFSLILMSLFTLYVIGVLLLLKGHSRPCTCGGIMRSLSWRQHLIVNVFFVIMSGLGLLLLNTDHPIEISKKNITYH